jgi:hypothetical protein
MFLYTFNVFCDCPPENQWCLARHTEVDVSPRSSTCLPRTYTVYCMIVNFISFRYNNKIIVQIEYRCYHLCTTAYYTVNKTITIDNPVYVFFF